MIYVLQQHQTMRRRLHQGGLDDLSIMRRRERRRMRRTRARQAVATCFGRSISPMFYLKRYLNIMNEDGVPWLSQYKKEFIERIRSNSRPPPRLYRSSKTTLGSNQSPPRRAPPPRRTPTNRSPNSTNYSPTYSMSAHERRGNTRERPKSTEADT